MVKRVPMVCETSDPAVFFESLRPGQLLETLFDAVPDAYFFVKDRESRFMSASQSFVKMLGATSLEDLVGKTDFDFSPDFLAKAFFIDDQRVMSQGQTMLGKVELVPSEYSLDWLSTTKMPLYDNEESVIGLAGVCHVIRDSDDLYQNHPEMRRIVDFIAENFREKVTVADMAREAGISVSSVERLFRGTFGVTPLMYLHKTRLNAACWLLRQDDANLSVIATDCGFHDQTGMTRAFRQELKITPLKYRQRFREGHVVRRTATGQDK